MLEEAKYERIGYEEYKGMPDYYSRYLTPACVTVSQISCIMGLIKEYRFADGSRINNVAETGVNIGLTDFYMLRVGTKYNDDFHLWGIEKIDEGNMGSVVKKEATDEEKAHWDFCIGKTVYDIESFMPEGVKLDMVFIDGAHAHPYPLIDLVFLLPYMRRDGLILFHDCEYYPLDGELGNSYIFTSWIGEKYLNRNINNVKMSVAGKETLGIVRVPSEADGQRILEKVARLPISKPYYPYASKEQISRGEYLGITQEDIYCKIKPFMEKYYSYDFAKHFANIFSKSLNEYEEKEAYYFHLTRISHYYFDRINELQMQIDELNGGGYAFPWDQIEKGSHIILYGGAVVGKAFFRMVNRSGYADVDMVCDRNFENIGYGWEIPVCSPEELKEKEDDRKIVIATESEAVSKEITKSLISMGVNEKRIVWEDPRKR